VRKSKTFWLCIGYFGKENSDRHLWQSGQNIPRLGIKVKLILQTISINRLRSARQVPLRALFKLTVI